jgi:hypothetical protein
MHAATLSRFSLVLLALAAFTLRVPAAVPLPGGALDEIDFERHIMGLLGRMGCNAGSCHGSFQGKGGFRLSLFGYDPARDHTTLTRELLGRRINSADPDNSLLLLKATGQVDHGGGRRFGREDWQYKVFRAWVARGARWNRGKGEVDDLIVTPSAHALVKLGEKERVRVKARFAGGGEEDIAPFCVFRVQDDAVASVSPLGEVRARQPGDTALVVTYRGNVRAIRVLVPMTAAPGFRYPDVPDINFIDREVFAKLKRLNIVPSELASDAEFLRRVYIDTIGCLPTPEELRAFLADKRPEKRAKKIDELLASPLHGSLWATKFSDITGNSTPELAVKDPKMQGKYSQLWHDWFKKRIADNMPYDQIVRGVLCATSREGRTPAAWLKEMRTIEEGSAPEVSRGYAERGSLDLFWRIGRAPTLESLGERTAAAFLGIRLECAQCHKHPFDRWTQVDYRAFANLFGQVAVGISPEAVQAVEADNKTRGLKPVKNLYIGEVYLSGSRRSLPHPDSDQPGQVVKGKGGKPIVKPAALPARALGGPEIPIEENKDARLALLEWMRSPSNAYFARSFVNRVWGHYFGLGIVDPVDNFSLANPGSNEKLLDALAKDFVDHQYDIRHLERTLLNSRVYQLTSATNETNRLDRNNYSHSYLRPMMAEVVVDVLNSALGVTESFGSELPMGSHAIEVGSTRVVAKNATFVFRVFGRPPRTSACDCERASEPALPQTLYLMADQAILEKLRATTLPGKGKGEARPDGRLAKLFRSKLTDNEMLDELFLATLTRYPSEAERRHFITWRKERKTTPTNPVTLPKKAKGEAEIGLTGFSERELAFVDVLWALINTREFILNH